jgi:alpha-glucosidase
VADSHGERFTLAEVGGDDPLAEMHAFTEGEERLNSAYGFDFLYAEKLTPQLVARVSEDWPESAGWPTWAFENHDAPRALSRWAAEDDRDAFARVKMLLLCALRGSIIIYQGEELGLPQVDVPFHRLRDPEAIANWPETLSRDGARTPMPWKAAVPNLGFSEAEPWLPPGECHRALAVDAQEEGRASILHFARECLALRSAHPALRHGSMRIIEAGEQRLVFERSFGGNRLLCTFNLSDQLAPYAPLREPLISTGEVNSNSLGPHAAVIEAIE